MPVLHSRDKSSPRERKDKRHLVRQGATIFKERNLISSGVLALTENAVERTERVAALDRTTT